MDSEHSQTPLTPQEAWKKLTEGNSRFIQGATEHPNQDGARRQSLVTGQEPFAVIFGCSDSRLAAEIIFDVGLGDVFVVRTAGHVLDPASLGSLEFAVDILNIPLIVILGHDSCGAVTSAIKAKESGIMPKGFVRDLVEHIIPSVFAAESANITDVNGTVVEHVKQTTARLVDLSSIIETAIAEGRTAVAGVAYKLAEGEAQLVSNMGLK
ncbi:carbonic anhydrase [Arthrobacter sp. MYb211]|uniref:carbonic anhydrase n=1 Tax=Micrococcaceae TaxID=1268 RepID=UPI000BB8C96F|nr:MULTISPECIES: carbonic anhydrase [Micrococcaceae]PCC28084.1 carbonic anhydrase [Glutamicibacter sp. BW80]PQZ98326.1 carbonic anhydrase [Arthrobacter sp. MYb224]PQZ98558.1 carbonic anhydrase [Arthrobacter sp. MYb229]PRA09973.1 carbonic anhydrase [Arthrobacter sp. MYb221]PRB47200.1 carbonic anhydrase [Arthrobacter sp. MYb216]